MADRLSADWPTFATLPAGRFAMGTAEQHLSTLARHYGGTRESYREETPQHDVTVAHCAIATTPVTVGWYARFVADTGTAAPAGWSGGMPPAGRELHPVVDVTWHDARAFCAWLTPQLAAAPAWHNWHARLPTEAEWEYAARGTDGRQFPWGDAWQPDAANTRECGLALTTPVGSWPAGVSPAGCHDMAGNVWEWTHTLDRGYPYRADDGREDPGAAGRRIARGGCYANPHGYARCACRFRMAPTVRNAFLGFRVVLAAHRAHQAA